MSQPVPVPGRPWVLLTPAFRDAIRRFPATQQQLAAACGFHAQSQLSCLSRNPIAWSTLYAERFQKLADVISFTGPIVEQLDPAVLAEYLKSLTAPRPSQDPRNPERGKARTSRS